MGPKFEVHYNLLSTVDRQLLTYFLLAFFIGLSP
jgi:hypothetical protein